MTLIFDYFSLFQFNFLPTTIEQTSGPVFIIDDGAQPKIELASKDRNVIAATFTHFLLKNIGGSETFKDKQDFFYHEVRKFHAHYYHEKLSLKVQRDKILESSLKSTKGFSVSDWCGNFEVTFQGEQGIDWGGLRREWFELICSSLFDPRCGLFNGFHDKRQALVHPNPNRPANLKLKHYEFAGKVVGKCLYESALGGTYRQLVRARFSRSFLAQLIGLRVHFKVIEMIFNFINKNHNFLFVSSTLNKMILTCIYQKSNTFWILIWIQVRVLSYTLLKKFTIRVDSYQKPLNLFQTDQKFE